MAVTFSDHRNKDVERKMGGNGVTWLFRVSVATALLAIAGLWTGPGHGETGAAISDGERPASAWSI